MQAGLNRVLVPHENYPERFEHMGIRVEPVDNAAQVLEKLLLPVSLREPTEEAAAAK